MADANADLVAEQLGHEDHEKQYQQAACAGSDYQSDSIL